MVFKLPSLRISISSYTNDTRRVTSFTKLNIFQQIQISLYMRQINKRFQTFVSIFHVQKFSISNVVCALNIHGLHFVR